MGDTGLEPAPRTPSKTPISEESGTESGTVGAPKPLEDPDLALITNRWPDLPEATRSAIVAIVKAAVGVASMGVLQAGKSR
jgi:hypothetical protein